MQPVCLDCYRFVESNMPVHFRPRHCVLVTSSRLSLYSVAVDLMILAFIVKLLKQASEEMHFSATNQHGIKLQKYP